MLTYVLLRKKWTVSGHHLGKNCAEFGIVREVARPPTFLSFFYSFFLPNTPHSSSIITAAATCFEELILDTEMYEQRSESAHAWVW
jgi:hypothetical protein